MLYVVVTILATMVRAIPGAVLSLALVFLATP